MKSLRSVALASILLFLLGPLGAQAATIWTLQPGSSFFDSSAGTTQSLTGTLTTDVVDVGTDWRQNITDITISGATVSFVEASFGGGAIDIVKAIGPVSQVQIIIGSPDSSRFKYGLSSTVSFTGTPDAPTSLTLVDLEPFIFGGHDLEPADRLTLILVPEPSTALMVGLGLCCIASSRGRERSRRSQRC